MHPRQKGQMLCWPRLNKVVSQLAQTVCPHGSKHLISLVISRHNPHNPHIGCCLIVFVEFASSDSDSEQTNTIAITAKKNASAIMNILK